LHTQPLELGWLRESIRAELSDGAYPQLVLRFGAVIQAATSVRRPPGDVLSDVAAKMPMPAMSERRGPLAGPPGGHIVANPKPGSGVREVVPLHGC
jgi:hypothetical protein